MKRPLVTGHIPALDGVRGVAILLVMLYHMTPWRSAYHGWREFPFSVADVGWCGVDLFFVLSAFLITNILLDTRENERYFRDFYMRRVLRIFPLYYVTIAVECLLLPHILGVHKESTAAGLHQQWALWTYTANMVTNIFRGEWLWLSHMWTLSMEEQFYLIWAVIIALVPRHRILTAITSMAVIVLAIQTIGLFSGTVAIVGPFLLRPELLCRYNAFIFGSWFAVALRTPNAAALLRRLLPWTAIVLGIVIGQSIRLHVLANALLTEMTPAVRWTKVLGFPALAIFFSSIVALAAAPHGGLWQRLFSVRPLQFLGKYSYGIYVLHGVLLPAFDRLIPRGIARGDNAASLLYFVIGSTLSVCAALASYYVLERPFLRLKKYFGGARPQSPMLSS